MWFMISHIITNAHKTIQISIASWFICLSNMIQKANYKLRVDCLWGIFKYWCTYFIKSSNSIKVQTFIKSVFQLVSSNRTDGALMKI